MLNQETQSPVHSGALLYQHTITGLLAIGFYLTFYVSKYHVQRYDALPGGVLCDSPLGFVIRVPNIIESAFSYLDLTANKNACTWIWSVFEQ